MQAVEMAISRILIFIFESPRGLKASFVTFMRLDHNRHLLASRSSKSRYEETTAIAALAEAKASETIQNLTKTPESRIFGSAADRGGRRLPARRAAHLCRADGSPHAGGGGKGYSTACAGGSHSCFFPAPPKGASKSHVRRSPGNRGAPGKALRPFGRVLSGRTLLAFAVSQFGAVSPERWVGWIGAIPVAAAAAGACPLRELVGVPDDERRNGIRKRSRRRSRARTATRLFLAKL